MLNTSDILIWSSDLTVKPKRSSECFGWHQDEAYAHLGKKFNCPQHIFQISALGPDLINCKTQLHHIDLVDPALINLNRLKKDLAQLHLQYLLKNFLLFIKSGPKTLLNNT